MTTSDDTSKTNGRRTGDTIAIDGAYQYRALTSGNAVQRFWHASKQLVIGQFLPPSPGDFVVDVGCGSGVVSNYLGSFGARVWGVDGNEAAIEFARGKFGSETVSFVRGYVDEHIQLPQPPDKMYCLEVIEHIYPDQGVAMLRVFHNLLKPGGKVLLTTPNYRSLWPIIEWALDRHGAAAHMAEDQHVCHYHPARLRQTAEQAGFTVETLTTFCFLAPWVAPVSNRFAHALHRIEVKSPLKVGSLILAVLVKQS